MYVLVDCYNVESRLRTDTQNTLLTDTQTSWPPAGSAQKTKDSSL